MKTGRRSLPESFYTHIPKVNPQVNALPFYIKEVSYSGKHLLMKGSKNNYSDYLILYSLTDMVFIKNRVKSQIACKLRSRTDSFAEQNGRGAVRADRLIL